MILSWNRVHWNFAWLIANILLQSYIQLKQSDRLIVCGQAMSHCVNYTLRDIVQHWPKDERNKITLLKDCASSVPGFEDASERFIEDMLEAGVAVEISESVCLL